MLQSRDKLFVTLVEMIREDLSPCGVCTMMYTPYVAISYNMKCLDIFSTDQDKKCPEFCFGNVRSFALDITNVRTGFLNVICENTGLFKDWTSIHLKHNSYINVLM